jgi:hypothetical protein
VGWVIFEVIEIAADEVIAAGDLMFPSGIAGRHGFLSTYEAFGT